MTENVWKLHQIQVSNSTESLLSSTDFVLVRNDKFKRCFYVNDGISCKKTVQIIPDEKRQILCQRANACKGKCCENQLSKFILVDNFFVACGNNADYPMCFVFGENMQRMQDLDFHTNSIRTGRESLIDINKSGNNFCVISLSVTFSNHLWIHKNDQSNGNIQTRDLGYIRNHNLQLLGSFPENECDWSSVTDRKCISSYLYNDLEHHQSHMMRICKNDPGTGKQTWNYFDHIKLRCCDDRYEQRDLYTCADEITSTLRFKEKIFAVFKPKLTLGLPGENTSFLCVIDQSKIMNKLGMEQELCNFTSISEPRGNRDKTTVVVKRITSVEQHLKLIGIQSVAEQEMFIAAQHEELLWFTSNNGKIKRFGTFGIDEYAKIFRDYHSNVIIQKGLNIQLNPQPQCQQLQYHAKYSCYHCQSSKNPFCSKFDGQRCQSSNDINCDDLEYYTNSYQRLRTGFIFKNDRAIIMDFKLSVEDSDFWSSIDSRSLLVHTWMDKKGNTLSKSDLFDLQKIEVHPSVCTEDVKYYLYTYFETEENIVSEEIFYVQNKCEDMRDSPISTSTIRTSTTTRLNTLTIAEEDNIEDEVSSTRVYSTEEILTSQSVKEQTTAITGIAIAGLIPPGTFNHITVVSTLLMFILGLTIGLCVGRRKKSKKYREGTPVE